MINRELKFTTNKSIRWYATDIFTKSDPFKPDCSLLYNKIMESTPPEEGFKWSYPEEPIPVNIGFLDRTTDEDF